MSKMTCGVMVNPMFCGLTLLRLGKVLQRAEKSVAGIPQTRDNVGLFV